MHRDIKPENIMFGGPENKDIKLIDSGFAIKPKLGEELNTVGTDLYNAPEKLS